MSTVAQMVLYDIFANRPAFGIAGRLFFATDTGVWYRDSGSAWQVIGTFFGSGTTGLRPAVTITGSTYFDTTLGFMIFWNGSTWVDDTGTPR